MSLQVENNHGEPYSTGKLLTNLARMTLTEMVNPARSEKQIPTAMPACIGTLNPSCALTPEQRTRQDSRSEHYRELNCNFVFGVIQLFGGRN